MRLTHLADYAVVLMTAAARRDVDARLSATDLSLDTGVPLPTTQKLMQQLAAGGLLIGQRGAGGGYALARPVDEITLADIVEAVEGPFTMTMCADGVNHECLLDAHCKVKPHMGIVGDTIRGALASVSLDTLTRSPAQAGVQVGEAEARATRVWAMTETQHRLGDGAVPSSFAGEQGVAK